MAAINAGAAEVGAINVCASKAGASEVGMARTALGAGLAGDRLVAPVVLPVVVVGGLP